MCRSIKTLRAQEPPATEDDISAAALQFVRKISGYRAPSRANRETFDRAVAEVAAACRKAAGLTTDPVAEKGRKTSVKRRLNVVPAKAGTSSSVCRDSRLRGNGRFRACGQIPRHSGLEPESRRLESNNDLVTHPHRFRLSLE